MVDIAFIHPGRDNYGVECIVLRSAVYDVIRDLASFQIAKKGGMRRGSNPRRPPQGESGGMPP